MTSLLSVLLAGLLWGNASRADDAPLPMVTIIDPYIELHTGPGRGYPIVHVSEKGEVVTILKRRTDWFKVQTRRGKLGWVKRRQMRDTLGPDGQLVNLGDPTLEDFLGRRWEFGFTGGDFEGADSLTASLGYRFNKNISAEIKVGQATGSFSNSKLVSLALVHQPFPEWRLSPFFTLGASQIQTEPDATLVATEDRTDNALLVGLGAYYYVSRRLMLRLEYSNHLILTSREVNEEINEWKAGISVFF
ncbi:SH3 domain-containing protein [Exilibacterium tricleocarpae]|nr:SH3 domain-containing protein [Exilibacterium tricleocarpae]